MHGEGWEGKMGTRKGEEEREEQNGEQIEARVNREGYGEGRDEKEGVNEERSNRG